MDRDAIAEIGIDAQGRLYVSPRTKTFPQVYRETMEVHWDRQGRYLYSPPPPRAQLAAPNWWFDQILSAAREQGCELQIAMETTWHNVPGPLKDEIISKYGRINA